MTREQWQGLSSDEQLQWLVQNRPEIKLAQRPEHTEWRQRLELVISQGHNIPVRADVQSYLDDLRTRSAFSFMIRVPLMAGGEAAYEHLVITMNALRNMHSGSIEITDFASAQLTEVLDLALFYHSGLSIGSKIMGCI